MRKLITMAALMLCVCFTVNSVDASNAFLNDVQLVKFTDQKTKISEADLPDDVRNSFDESAYGDWEILDVYQEEGDGEDMDVYYEINVKGYDEENVSLLYDANGRLVETR